MRRKLSFDDEKDLVLLGKALSSEIRIKILKLLDTKPYCVNEIAPRRSVCMRRWARSS